MTAPVHRRLDSWKAIAAYLDRDVRTVIRWEKERRLPVHRVPGGIRQAVFAYEHELDAWAAGKTAEAEVPADSSATSSARASELIQGRTPWYRRTVSISLGIVSLLVVGVILVGDWQAASTAGPLPLTRPLDFARVDFSASLPKSILAADFTGDNKLDLAFTNSAANTISVLPGDGAGGFGSRVDSPSGTSPERLAVGDFDGDGKLDLAVTHSVSGDLEILLGKGNGGFSTRERHSTNGRARWVSSADVNADGLLDLAVAASAAGRLLIFLGRGNGTFRNGDEYPAEEDVSSLAIADFNGDGRPDIAAGDYHVGTGRSISLYVGRGDGTFHPRATFLSGLAPLGIAAADINADGRADIVTADFRQGASVLLGSGQGAFSAPRPLVAGNAPGFAQVADMDRDGRLDLVILNEHSDDLSILLGRGDGTFEPARPMATGKYPDACAAGDFDRDGKMDLATANVFGNSVSVFLNRSEPASRSSSRWRAALPSVFQSHP